MEEEFNNNIEKFLQYLGISFAENGTGFLEYKTLEGLKKRGDIIEKARQILGVDEICFNCNKFKFKYDLVLVEGMAKKVCQECAEGLINGDLKINEKI